MLAGTSSNFYSLTEVNNMLEVAKQLLDCNEPQLLRASHHAEVATAFIKFIQPELNNNKDGEEKLIVAAITAFKTLQAEKGDFNRNHMLAFLFTHYFQKGDLFDLDRVSVIISWHLFQAGLKELSSNKEMDPNAIEGIFLGFMGELQKANQFETLKAIHHYFHISYQIVAAKDNGMPLEHCAAILGPSLLEGLKLQDKILPGDVPAEWKMMSTICRCLLQLDLFKEPFTAEKYTLWSLPKSEFYKTREKALGQLHVTPVATYEPNGAEILKKQTHVAKLIKGQAAIAATKKESAEEASEGTVTPSPLERGFGELQAALLDIPETVMLQFSEKKASSQSTDSNPKEESKSSKKKSAMSNSKK
ncbi:hypothetical protein [Candidatus Berkiella aquae]|uniref:Uncharacterized protein n=1 Tax=Candidatus Berkiella aquae TaxID=295108 RepID=A0A0Q9YIF3_9GAMM|nr:hypothetical protein [Candidatus Berkiella aquae]MCS5712269.1 hypothetical protein [Candidatus Berkiella aquae]